MSEQADNLITFDTSGEENWTLTVVDGDKEPIMFTTEEMYRAALWLKKWLAQPSTRG